MLQERLQGVAAVSEAIQHESAARELAGGDKPDALLQCLKIGGQPRLTGHEPFVPALPRRGANARMQGLRIDVHHPLLKEMRELAQGQQRVLLRVVVAPQVKPCKAHARQHVRKGVIDGLEVALDHPFEARLVLGAEHHQKPQVQRDVLQVLAMELKAVVCVDRLWQTIGGPSMRKRQFGDGCRGRLLGQDAVSQRVHHRCCRRRTKAQVIAPGHTAVVIDRHRERGAAQWQPCFFIHQKQVQRRVIDLDTLQDSGCDHPCLVDPKPLVCAGLAVSQGCHFVGVSLLEQPIHRAQTGRFQILGVDELLVLLRDLVSQPVVHIRGFG